MGQFSWIYSDTHKPMLDDVHHNSYLLIPEEYRSVYGPYILETCYDGYGNFGSFDVYDLVADMNREFIPDVLKRHEENRWKCTIEEKDIKDLTAFYEGREYSCEKRWLGIILACYDEDNASLPYPIKIVEHPVPYNDAEPSESDPNQGWLYEDGCEVDDY